MPTTFGGSGAAARIALRASGEEVGPESIPHPRQPHFEQRYGRLFVNVFAPLLPTAAAVGSVDRARFTVRTLLHGLFPEPSILSGSLSSTARQISRIIVSRCLRALRTGPF